MGLSPLNMKANEFYQITRADKKFLAKIVEAVNRNDVAWIARHSSYTLTTGKPRRLIKGEKEFAALLRHKLTEKVRTKILNDAKQPLFKNWRGVMVGDGIVWFSEFEDEKHHESEYAILSFGGFAWQPEDWLQAEGK
jgi:hypothetical protein